MKGKVNEITEMLNLLKKLMDSQNQLEITDKPSFFSQFGDIQIPGLEKDMQNKK